MFHVIADPTRRKILDLLLEQDMTVGEIVLAVDVGQPAVSKHLRQLREAGLVTSEQFRTRRRYSLRPEGLRELEEWLAPYREAWNAEPGPDPEDSPDADDS